MGARSSLLAVILLSVLWAGCSLAGDITPPPALATAQMAPPLPTREPTPQPVRFPSTGSLDLENGASIFAEKCAGCHGPAGSGDGELADNLDVPPAALADADLARQATPRDWYSIVTIGNIARFMPGFTSLDESERWDVVAFSLSLSTSLEEVEFGQEIYQVNCAECHGDHGEGSPGGSSLLDGEVGFDRSLTDLYEVVSQGAAPSMPAFAGSLQEPERWAVALHARQLASGIGPLDIPVVSRPTSPAASSEKVSAAVGEIRGQVVNGTSGAPLPVGLQIILSGFDGETLAVDAESGVDEAGRYAFPDLEIVPGRLFLTSLEYDGVVYQSEVAHLLETEPVLDLPLTIYETLNDPAGLRIDRLHILLDFPAEDVLRVLELWVLDNPTDRVLVSDGSEGVVRVDLPPEAGNIRFEEGAFGERFLLAETGFFDTQPVPPGVGSQQLVFSFDLAYGQRLEMEQPVQYPVGAVVILVPEGGPEVRGNGVTDLGARDMGGILMRQYSLEGISPGGSLALQISGRLGASTGAAGYPIELLVGVIGLILAGVFAFGYWRGVPSKRSTGGIPAAMEKAAGEDRARRTRDTIIREIALLDARFERRELEPDEYRNHRETLIEEALRTTGPDHD